MQPSESALNETMCFRYPCKNFVFSSRRRHRRLVSDWSSDVCSSDLCTMSTSAATARALADRTKVHIWRIRNRLKDRAMLGAAAGPGSFDTTALETAQEQFEQMSEEYVDWVGGTFSELSQAIAEVGELVAEKRLLLWERIHRIAHEL